MPVELYKGLASMRRDLANTPEEADTIILHQLAVVKPKSAIVVADDTDIFVLLCHFLHVGVINIQVWMVAPIKGRSVIDINASVGTNDDIMGDLLFMHGLTGCDTVAPYFGIGKGVALRALRTQRHSLSLLGDVKAPLNDVVKQCTSFILACYGENTDSASEARYNLWMKKVSRNIANAPKLQSLPPTDEALFQNIARAHIQVAVWRNSHEPHPPALDPSSYGWYMKDGSLAAVMIPPNTLLAPDTLLKIIKCSCKGEKPCSRQRCSCNISGMTCTFFCNCKGEDECWNHYTRINNVIVDSDSDNDN